MIRKLWSGSNFWKFSIGILNQTHPSPSLSASRWSLLGVFGQLSCSLRIVSLSISGSQASPKNMEKDQVSEIKYTLCCKSILLCFYYKYWSYKWYNPFFLDCTVRINIFSFIFSKNSIFHVIKKIFRSKTSTYIGKLKKISHTVHIIGPVRIIGT